MSSYANALLSTSTTNATRDSQQSSIVEAIRDIARTALAANGNEGMYEYMPAKTPSASGTGIIQVSVIQLRDANMLNKCDSSCVAEARAAGRSLREAKLNCSGCNPHFNVIAAAKVQILWKLLDPSLDIVGKTARNNPAVSEYMQEIIRTRLEEILEQKVLQNPRDHNHDSNENGLDLLRIVGQTPKQHKDGSFATVDDIAVKDGGVIIMNDIADPVAWARRILFASLAATTRRVFNTEQVNLSSFDVETPTSADPGLYRDIVDFDVPMSAEEQYIHEADEEELFNRDSARGASAEAVFEQWETDSHNKRGIDKLVVNARALHSTFELPELTVTGAGGNKRRLAALIAADPDLAYRSLRGFYDLSAGEPNPSQLTIDDDLISLWDNYTPDQAERLLAMNAGVPQLLVEAALTLPMKPGRAALREPRQLLRAASGASGWSSVANKAFDTFLAEHYAWFNDHDNRGRTPEAEAAAAELAAAWPAAAKAVLAWVNKPAGATAATIDDVASWIRGVLPSN